MKGGKGQTFKKMLIRASYPNYLLINEIATDP